MLRHICPLSFIGCFFRSRLCRVGLHQGESAKRKPRRWRRQDLLLFQRGGERIRLLWQHHCVEDRPRVQGKTPAISTQNSRAKTWGAGRLELPVNNPPPNNCRKTKACGPHVLSMHHVCVDTIEKHQCPVYEFNWTNVFWMDSFSFGLTCPLLLLFLLFLTIFLCNVISLSRPPPSQCQLHSSFPPNRWALKALLVFNRALQNVKLFFSFFLFAFFICTIWPVVFQEKIRYTVPCADLSHRSSLQAQFVWSTQRINTRRYPSFRPSSEQLRVYESAWLYMHSASVPDRCVLFMQAVMWVIAGTACNLKWQLNDLALPGSRALHCDTSQS